MCPPRRNGRFAGTPEAAWHPWYSHLSTFPLWQAGLRLPQGRRSHCTCRAAAAMKASRLLGESKAERQQFGRK